MLAATREIRQVVTNAVDGPFVGLYSKDVGDLDGALEQNIGQMRVWLIPRLATLAVTGRALDARARLERLFRTVLSRHVCAGAPTDRPWMNEFRAEWIRLGLIFGVNPPELAYHCWCQACSDERKVAPVKSLALCSRCKIAACAWNSL